MKNTSPRVFASFLDRLAAHIIDSIVIGLVSGVFVSIGGFSYSQNHFNYSGLGLGTLAGIAYILYFWIKQDGQTIGKKVMGIKIVTTTGKPIDFSVALTRYIGYMLSGLIFNLGYLWVIFDTYKQGWHDKLANTYVVKTDSQKRTGLLVLVLGLFTISLLFVGFLVSLFIIGASVLFKEASTNPDFRQELQNSFKEGGTPKNIQYKFSQ